MGNYDRRPPAQSSAEAPGPPVGAETLSRPLTRNVLDGTAPPRSILEPHHRTALGTGRRLTRDNGHHGDPYMAQTLQVSAHDRVFTPYSWSARSGG